MQCAMRIQKYSISSTTANAGEGDTKMTDESSGPGGPP